MTKIYVSHPFGGLAKNKKNADFVLKWLRCNRNVQRLGELNRVQLGISLC